MGADNFIILNSTTFEVSYGMADKISERFKCKTLREAVNKAKELDEEFRVEYGVCIK